MTASCHHRFHQRFVRVGGIRRREPDATKGRNRVSEEYEEESPAGIRGMRRGEPSGYQRNAKRRAQLSALAAALLGLVLYFPLPGGSACSFVAVQPPAAQPPGRPLFLKSLQPRLVHARLRGGQGDNTTWPWKREDNPPLLYTDKIRGLDDDWCEINFKLFRSFLLMFLFPEGLCWCCSRDSDWDGGLKEHLQPRENWVEIPFPLEVMEVCKLSYCCHIAIDGSL